MIRSTVRNFGVEFAKLRECSTLERLLFYTAFLMVFLSGVLVNHGLPYWSESVTLSHFSTLIQTVYFTIVFVLGFLLVNIKWQQNIPHPLGVTLLLVLTFPTLIGWVVEREAGYSSLPQLLLILPLSILLSKAFQVNRTLFFLFLGIAVSLIPFFQEKSIHTDSSWFMIAGISVLFTSFFFANETGGMLIQSKKKILFWGLFLLLAIVLPRLGSTTILGQDAPGVWRMFQSNWAFGVGLNGAPRALLEFTTIPFSERALESNNIILLLAEFGFIPLFPCCLIGGYGLFSHRKEIFKSSNNALILAILLCLAVFTYPLRLDTILLLALLLVLSTQATLQQNHCGVTLYIRLLLVVFFLISLQVLLAPSLYESGVRSSWIQGYWAHPRKELEFDYRTELSQKQHPSPEEVLRHRELVNDWVSVTPHNELALIQSVRWAYSTMPLNESLAVAKANHARNPWSPVLTIWVVRILIDLDQLNKAKAFLITQTEKYTPPHPIVLRRLEELNTEGSIDEPI